jgi:hypothetical protein
VDPKVRFEAPGRYGQLSVDANIWRKGIIYTRRSTSPDLSGESAYKISAAFKCGPAASAAQAGFKALYRRVRSLAEQAIADNRCPGATRGVIKTLCHGWRRVGEANLSATFITLELRCCVGHHEDALEWEPTDQDFLEPGGSPLEELARLNPQQADEVYNEFDFTNSSAHEADFVTMSYGERIPIVSPLNFEPFVRKAEKQAARYHGFLKDHRETRCGSFRIVHREWFLANNDFVTVHVCFER